MDSAFDSPRDTDVTILDTSFSKNIHMSSGTYDSPPALPSPRKRRHFGGIIPSWRSDNPTGGSAVNDKPLAWGIFGSVRYRKQSSTSANQLPLSESLQFRVAKEDSSVVNGKSIRNAAISADNSQTLI